MQGEQFGGTGVPGERRWQLDTAMAGGWKEGMSFHTTVLAPGSSL